MKFFKVIFIAFVLVIVGFLPVNAGEKLPVPSQLPIPNMVTVIDLGATQCIPCKMMAPILSELSKEYQGRAAVVFIDVRENPPMAKKFGTRSIPTQIFYDADGREIFRHEGFFDKPGISSKLNEILGQRITPASQTVVELPVGGVANLIMIDMDNNPSTQSNPHVDMLSDIQSLYGDQVKVIYSDARKHPEIASQLKVIKAPVLLFFDANGKEVFRSNGLLTREQIVEMLNKMGFQQKGLTLAKIPAEGRPTLLLLDDERQQPNDEFFTVLNEIAQQYNENLAVFYAVREKSFDLVARFKPSKYPVYLVFDSKGQESYRHYGVATKDVLMAQLLKIGIKP